MMAKLIKRYRLFWGCDSPICDYLRDGYQTGEVPIVIGEDDWGHNSSSDLCYASRFMHSEGFFDEDSDSYRFMSHSETFFDD